MRALSTEISPRSATTSSGLTDDCDVADDDTIPPPADALLESAIGDRDESEWGMSDDKLEAYKRTKKEAPRTVVYRALDLRQHVWTTTNKIRMTEFPPVGLIGLQI
jgi:hypothetical protein